jgi:hypothetical protein
MIFQGDPADRPYGKPDLAQYILKDTGGIKLVFDIKVFFEKVFANLRKSYIMFL